MVFFISFLSISHARRLSAAIANPPTGHQSPHIIFLTLHLHYCIFKLQTRIHVTQFNGVNDVNGCILNIFFDYIIITHSISLFSSLYCIVLIVPTYIGTMTAPSLKKVSEIIHFKNILVCRLQTVTRMVPTYMYEKSRNAQFKL